MPTPKFLTEDMAKRAVTAVFDLVFEAPVIGLKPHRAEAHVVILAPQKRDFRSASLSTPYLLPAVLYEASYGNPEEFQYPYQRIAHSKASQLWHDQNDGGTDIVPHLLFEGDTPFWGGVKRSGLVVACSGVQPWLDRMISGMIIDMLVAMSHQAWVESEDKADGELCFLT